MYTRLKGINSKTKTLADGTAKTYWWAWKGGPPLKGEPGSPEFIASYNEAITQKVEPPPGTLIKLIRGYEETSEFDDLAPRTKRDYRQKLALIETEFADFPVAALSDPGARGVFKKWRDKLAKRSKRQADYAWVVLARVLSVAKDRGEIPVNRVRKGGASTQDHAATRSGRWRTKALFWRGRPQTCICHSSGDMDRPAPR